MDVSQGLPSGSFTKSATMLVWFCLLSSSWAIERRPIRIRTVPVVRGGRVPASYWGPGGYRVKFGAHADVIWALFSSPTASSNIDLLCGGVLAP
jgi:hypothetical protein